MSTTTHVSHVSGVPPRLADLRVGLGERRRCLASSPPFRRVSLANPLADARRGLRFSRCRGCALGAARHCRPLSWRGSGRHGPTAYRRCQFANSLILDLRVCNSVGEAAHSYPHIPHASWLLGRGGLYQVCDISSSCVCCARLLWHVLDIGQVGLVVADFHRRWRPGLDVLHNVGIEVFDGLQD
jgi:hypothetical protein